MTVRSKFIEPLPALSQLVINQLVGFQPDESLITNAVADLNGKTLDLLTTLAEAPETESMIYDALTGVLSGVNEIN